MTPRDRAPRPSTTDPSITRPSINRKREVFRVYLLVSAVRANVEDRLIQHVAQMRIFLAGRDPLAFAEYLLVVDFRPDEFEAITGIGIHPLQERSEEHTSELQSH